MMRPRTPACHSQTISFHTKTTPVKYSFSDYTKTTCGNHRWSDFYYNVCQRALISGTAFPARRDAGTFITR